MRRFHALRRAPVLVWLAFVSGCASARFTVPDAPAVPAPEAPAAWEAATRSCREVRTARAMLRLAARGDRRVPRVRVGAVLDGGRAIGLQAESFFTLRGTADDATLVLRDGRFVRAAVPAIVEALIDVRLDPARLLAILTGCLTPEPALVNAARRDRWLVVTLPDGVAYLEARAGGSWELRAGTFGDLQVDYVRRGSDWPRDIAIASSPGAAGPVISITITSLEMLEVNGPLEPSLTEPVVPAGAVEISLDELRRVVGG